jgi:transcriptional regulator with XRE-family HTH domain
MNKEIKFEKVKKIRKKKGFSCKFMAEEMTRYGYKMVESTYYKKESGILPVTIDEANNISNILNKSPLIFFSK